MIFTLYQLFFFQQSIRKLTSFLRPSVICPSLELDPHPTYVLLLTWNKNYFLLKFTSKTLLDVNVNWMALPQISIVIYVWFKACKLVIKKGKNIPVHKTSTWYISLKMIFTQELRVYSLVSVLWYTIDRASKLCNLVFDGVVQCFCTE